MDKTSEDVVAFVASGVDAACSAVGAPPLASLIAGLPRVLNNRRNELLMRKVIAFWNEFNDSDVDKVLLAQTLSNFREEFGAEYFDEVLFSVIEKSDSAKRTKMISKLIIHCSTGDIPKENFWDVMSALQSLLMIDIQKLPRLLFIDEKVNSVVNPEVAFPELFSELQGIRNIFYQRLESVGLVWRPHGGGEYKIQLTLIKYVCKCL